MIAPETVWVCNGAGSKSIKGQRVLTLDREGVSWHPLHH